jgi:hypothetical protein
LIASPFGIVERRVSQIRSVDPQGAHASSPCADVRVTAVEALAQSIAPGRFGKDAGAAKRLLTR